MSGFERRKIGVKILQVISPFIYLKVKTAGAATAFAVEIPLIEPMRSNSLEIPLI